jgi:predicted porin
MVFAADIQEQPVAHGNVEVYGKARLSVDVIDTGAAAPADDSLTRLSSNSSRLGFKGSEDLGGDLKAVYQVELGIKMDGVLDTSLRNTFLGLNSKRAGTLLVGKHDTPYKLATGSLDAFGDTTGDYNAIIGNVNGESDFDRRAENTIHFISPTWGGFHLRAATEVTGSESDNTGTSAKSLYSASAVYKTGPLYAALGYETHKNGVTAWDTGTTITGGKVGVGLTFGGTTLGFVYEKLDDDNANSIYTRDAIYAAVSQKIGSETIKLAYGIADDGDDPATETGASQITAGVEHAFSKRTSVYALYTATDNDKDATYGIGQGQGVNFVPNAGEDPSSITIGINHNF